MRCRHDLLSSMALGIAALAACSGQRSAQAPKTASSQEAYEYPSCSNQGRECPRNLTLSCALKAIATKYKACSQHDDCVEAAIQPMCSGQGTCPPFFVNRQSKAAFEAEAQGEINRYCESARCSLPGLCPVVGSVHGYCTSKGCTWMSSNPFQSRGALKTLPWRPWSTSFEASEEIVSSASARP